MDNLGLVVLRGLKDHSLNKLSDSSKFYPTMEFPTKFNPYQTNGVNVIKKLEDGLVGLRPMQVRRDHKQAEKQKTFVEKIMQHTKANSQSIDLVLFKSVS